MWILWRIFFYTTIPVMSSWLMGRLRGRNFDGSWATLMETCLKMICILHPGFVIKTACSFIGAHTMMMIMIWSDQGQGLEAFLAECLDASKVEVEAKKGMISGAEVLVGLLGVHLMEEPGGRGRLPPLAALLQQMRT
jgi:hypothetical protein